jgi:hypothetical protein
MKWFWRVFHCPKVRKKNREKWPDLYIWSSVCSHEYRSLIKDLVYSQIWLNLPRDDPHSSYIFLWMIILLDYTEKFLEKTRTMTCLLKLRLWLLSSKLGFLKTSSYSICTSELAPFWTSKSTETRRRVMRMGSSSRRNAAGCECSRAQQICLAVLLLLSAAATVAECQIAPFPPPGLDVNFYGTTCPNLSTIVSDLVKAAVNAEARMAASLLRLHFHDCWPNVSKLCRPRMMSSCVSTTLAACRLY